MKRLLVIWAVNVAALFVASALLANVDYSSFWQLLLAGLVFGVVNSVLHPAVKRVLKAVAAPLVLLTFGIVLFLVNVLMLYVTSWVVRGFELETFGAAAGAAAIIWLVQTVLEAGLGLGARTQPSR